MHRVRLPSQNPLPGTHHQPLCHRHLLLSLSMTADQNYKVAMPGTPVLIKIENSGGKGRPSGRTSAKIRRRNCWVLLRKLDGRCKDVVIRWLWISAMRSESEEGFLKFGCIITKTLLGKQKTESLLLISQIRNRHRHRHHHHQPPCRRRCTE
ncbi:hypothetical protein OSB04_001006 [Centaurea solstitialis]|uniref:Uncharacterized protein n=1 Tax=Centaurea solstitialis TaxID=347529 RepID=A0AA38WSF3_9ASTR|nr:hypothetical protein OSB04_001006 [Centaurea solstitialis]